MTFLELCQRLRQECGVSGSGPAAVTGQTGVNLRLVDWIIQSWMDIQRMHDNWLFMWKEFSFDTVAATRDYLAADYSITDLAEWDLGSFLIYKTATGTSDQNTIPYMSYPFWRDQYRSRMAERSDDRPVLFTMLPDGNIRFEPRPDAAYTIDGDYRRTVQTLASNSDTPTGLADEYHMIIVWKAMIYYANRESAPEIKIQAEEALDEWLPQLEKKYLSEMMIGSNPIGESSLN